MSGMKNAQVAKPAFDFIESQNSGDTAAETEDNGIEIDLTDIASGRRFSRVRVSVRYKMVMTTGIDTVVFSSNLQHANATATGGTYADFGTAPTASTVTATGTTQGVFEYEQDLSTAYRFVRAQFACDFQTDTGGDATATGAVLSYAGQYNFMEATKLPASG